MDETEPGIVNDTDTLTPATRTWAAERGRLFGIAYRILGDAGHAEDVVSEVGIAALVHEREATEPIDSWSAWLTTVCVRRAIDHSRHLATVKEDYPGPWLPEPIATDQLPEEAVANRELLSLSLLHLAEQLSPEARAAFVLTRAFGMSTEEVAEILEKQPAAVRQMISRAARRLDAGRETTRPANRRALDRLVDAIRSGDMATSVRLLLSDDAVLWTDGGGKIASALNPVFGAEKIVRFFTSVLTPGDPDGQDVRGIVEVNGGLAIALSRDGRDRILDLELDAAGLIRGLRMVNNPDKLDRI
ncbi:sigma-70 family RNA polymerase sigma factor [Brevibacterium sp. GP-SGM9]|uniref:sigma-70 family RNA polymerase sigma factor n=1 Tax=Brevibacterium sp. GP-SGM9 TaxID=3376990 RepID=UPI0039A6003F